MKTPATGGLGLSTVVDDDSMIYSTSETGRSESMFISNEKEGESSINLDENGFPLLNHGWESDEDDDLFNIFENENQIFPDVEDQSARPTEEGDSFAAAFYRSGADWSSLKTDSEDERTPKRLRQSNLLQMWGFKDQEENIRSNEKAHPPIDRSDTRPSPSLQASPYLPSGTQKRPFDLRALGKNKKIEGNASLEARPSRPCPFYKKIPDTPFTVDAFKYGRVEGCSAYFLTHFHYDHYGGLTKKWTNGHIYCTHITARLIKQCLSVDSSFIHPLELDIEHHIEGIKVTFLEANHCPGAALIYFHLPSGKCYLHTGDFRACKAMQSYPILLNKRVDLLYLDTTYCNPKYRFPSKEQVLDFVVRTSQNHLKKHPRSLIVVGAYSIGKECVYVAISKALGVKIFANSSRRRVLNSYGWSDISRSLCANAKDTPLHVLPISSLRLETLQSYLRTYQDQFTGVIAFRPTGWTFSESIGNQLDKIKPSIRGNILTYGVPYSEHSSFDELQEFVQFLKPVKIIPTVNVGSAAQREKMQLYFRQWLKV